MKLRMLLTTLCFAAAAASCGQRELSSGIDKANMNDSIAPGEDFYLYCGGNWIKNHPLKPEDASYGQFNVLNDNNLENLRAMFESYAENKQEAGSLGQKIGDLYRLAMDSVKLNADGYKPIEKDLQKVQAINNVADYQELAAEFGKKGVNIGTFEVYVDADLTDAGNNLVQIYQGGLGLGNKDYYLNNDEQSVKILDAYKAYVVRCFKLVGYEKDAAEAKMNNIIALETEIAKGSYNRTELRDVPNNFHKMSYEQLKAEYPAIMWDELFAGLGYPEFKEISVGQPSQLKAVENILKTASIESIKDYAAYGVISGAANYLSDDFRVNQFELSKVLSGATEDKPRWKRAVGAVDGTLGMAVGKLYVEKYFPESSKQRMIQLVKNLQVALGERIDALDWMSDTTKAMAHEKLDNILIKIGYPDTWRDFSKLQISDTLSYYENMCNASEFYIQDMIDRKVNKPTDKNEWLMTPQTINAYYNPTTNEICFPAGILQPPFFNAEADDAANYGAIGVVIGHEMSHGFDDQGCQFDKDGNMKNWWTPADKERFDARTKVLADFFSTHEVLPGLNINGQLTLGENIGDNGGLNIAYTAFKNAMKDAPLGEKDGFTPEQRFFISYAYIWAGVYRDEAKRWQTLNDPHSLGEFRVNAALPNIDAWYDAFGIKEGDKLYLAPEKRARIW
ncbi:MAG: M13 family metallopeptidase [Candidatus Egerieousia sp.]